MSLSGIFTLFFFVLALGGGAAAYLLYGKWRKLGEENEQHRSNLDSLDRKVASYKKRFAPIVSLEEEVSKVQQQLSDHKNQEQEVLRNLSSTRAELSVLSEELASVQEIADLAEVGVYEPHFDFEASEGFKQKIEEVRNQQKEMIKDGEAVRAHTEWEVGGSKTEGRKMVKKMVQLTTRSFTNECEACIATATWANIDKMEARINKAFNDINKFNAVNNVVISPQYLSLKLNELRLTHEYKLKKQQEKEEQAEIRRQMREEEKAEREARAAAAKAQKEEDIYQGMLETARAEAEAAARALALSHTQQDQQEVERLQAQLHSLEEKLAEAHAQSVRAISMAQQTKTGHVYVISNVGSFGENIYKIGMTRRLDPQDRVNELGDASVPFRFDVHAIIHSTNAPELESQLHRAFASRRVNQINLRKEFFQVSLNDIRAEVVKIAPSAVFTTTAVADEFRQSQAIIKKAREADASQATEFVL